MPLKKRAIGARWEGSSSGKCLFVMLRLGLDQAKNPEYGVMGMRHLNICFR